jgi:hypothetical protein
METIEHMMNIVDQWPSCLQRNWELRALAPAQGCLVSFYGPHYLFQIAGDAYTVVDTAQATSFGPQLYVNVLELYPGFADVAIPIGPDLAETLKQCARPTRAAAPEPIAV